MRFTTSLHVALRFGAAAAVLGLAAACGATPTAEPAAPKPTAAAVTGTIITPASLKPGDPVPAPKGKPMLTLRGKISATNKGKTLELDHGTVEKFGVEQIRLYEPWTKENLDFRGVWLDDLLAVAGVPADATKVHIVALDDYAVDLTIADIRAGGVMLATRAGDGSMLPIDKGGPVRVVFADGVPAGRNPDQWIWSLKSIDVQ